MSDGESVGRREQLHALVRVAKYRPAFTAGIIGGGLLSAVLEGFGLSFILPIVRLVQSPTDPTTGAEGALGVFVAIYQYIGVPFTLGYVITGVSLVLAVRWVTTFLIRWLRSVLQVQYTRELQTRAFDSALDARIAYFDSEGSDDILNAIVTQAEYAGSVIEHLVNFIEQSLLIGIYLLVALVIEPTMTILTLGLLGGFSVLFRWVLDPGYEVGDKVADANERVQTSAQAGTQGIRETKLFGLQSELRTEFVDAVDQFASSSIKLRRNEEAIRNFYNLLTAISVFVLIYVAITVVNMSLGALGIFLFAMFRMAPKVSGLNARVYRIENNLPHLVRTQEFIDELRRNPETDHAGQPVPEEVRTVEFDDVHFSYSEQDEMTLSGISFELSKGEFVGFVGPSGAGKSTIVSLLARMYEPDEGVIRANGETIHDMAIDEWRDRLAVVRQNPHVFNDTLRYNLTIGNRDVSEAELERVCRIARVGEFLPDLPDRFETQLGDDGVRLSGGQRQRVALARALLKDADVLVLDEATSDLDSDLERQVQDAIETMDREYAIIGIAHRLSTITNADRIYTVDDGEIVETGRHEELIAKDGQYAELYAIQSQE